DHLDEDKPVDMIFNEGTGVNAFFLSFGVPRSEPVDEMFEYSRRGTYGIEFRRDFLAPASADGKAYPFTLVKRFNFEPGTYMFEIVVSIENSVNAFPNLNFAGSAYTFGFGPQIGPVFEVLGGRGEYRQYFTYEDGKRRANPIPRGGDEVEVENRFIWGGIVGKYFALLVAPLGSYGLTFAQPYTEVLPAASYMYLTRPLIKETKTEDRFLVYAGPKLVNRLAAFNDPADNSFGASDLNLDAAVDKSALLGWLESILKFFLDLFYKVIPNYGVAIIILSIFIKVVFYPITRKSFDSTAKMQTLTPKIEELKKKYPGKEKAQQLNQEMAALYKREKVNPLGGCLPLLIQMPIFIAFYGVLTKHFALRAAPFFGWITDLSEPDSLINFGSFTIPLLGWNDLRLLPIIYVGTQLLTSNMMQAPNSSSSRNMKLMQYFMPIFFFFILYNAPSGLLLYWTLTNVLSAIQQRATTAYRKTHKPKEKPGGGGDKRGGKKK
ncbi:MAG: YidC/Oxa1 family insertase periplasmic-domain containing protein, partial [Spirochaetales bacterium]|nr:YidC/Oxa1 family insertase periplasmic-domain containing protein [Spirochaetales bacterium]